MRKMFVVCLSILLGVGTSALVNAKSELIPVEDFAKHAAYRTVKISPDGEHLGFTFREGTEVKLAVMNRKSKKITGIFGFGDWMQVSNFHWGNNERVVMEVQKFVGYLDKKGGATHLFAANINGKHRKQIFKAQRSSFTIVSLYKKDPKHIIILNRHFADYNRSKNFAPVKALRLNIYTGRKFKLPGQPKEDVSYIAFDKNDEMRIASTYVVDEDKYGWGTYYFYIRDPGTGSWHKSPLSQYTNARIQIRGISADGRSAYMATDKDTKTIALYKYDLGSDKMEMVYANDRVDLGGLIRTQDKSIIGVTAQPDYTEYKFFDKNHREAKVLAGLFASFPGSDITFTSYTDDGKAAIAFVRSDVNPGDFYLYDFTKNSLKYVASAMPWIEPKQMAEMKPIAYKARDGVTIYGYLTLPKGKSKNLPLIVNPHGGPHGPRDSWGFNPDVQFLASRGYAVIQMNFRGSGGYGQEFEEMGYQKWGREMQDDVTDATLWAIKKGVADPNRICIYGGSYGGYATLMGVVREPDLYKCALGYVGVYDLETMFKAGDIPMRESGVKYLEHVLGTDKKVLHENSPAWNVDKIKASIFLAHGAEDVRVPMEQLEVLTDALDKAGIKYQKMVRDEGHGYQKYKNRLDFYKAMEKFFEANLGH